MSYQQNTQCRCAEALEAARSECRAKASQMPEHCALFLQVGLELTRMERRHFHHCVTCQATDVAPENLGVTA